MSHDAINNWVEHAKSGEAAISLRHNGARIITRDPRSKGNIIMELSELIRPFLSKMFEGEGDENNMVVQPARVRSIALNVAQSIVKGKEHN